MLTFTVCQCACGIPLHFILTETSAFTLCTQLKWLCKVVGNIQFIRCAFDKLVNGDHN